MQQNKSPLVSVIIPTYNSARTLETTLKSVKDQTYPNIEMIVVDIQSKDTTRQIAEKLWDRESKRRVYCIYWFRYGAFL